MAQRNAFLLQPRRPPRLSRLLPYQQPDLPILRSPRQTQRLLQPPMHALPRPGLLRGLPPLLPLSARHPLPERAPRLPGRLRYPLRRPARGCPSGDRGTVLRAIYGHAGEDSGKAEGVLRGVEGLGGWDGG